MAKPKNTAKPAPGVMQKCPSGVKGLDEITGGGLPRGRPTLVCGGTGCGKTLLAMEFLVRGATVYGEPGVFMSFEEKSEELANNFASLGYDLNDLVARNKLSLDYVHSSMRTRVPGATPDTGSALRGLPQYPGGRRAS